MVKVSVLHHLGLRPVLGALEMLCQVGSSPSGLLPLLLVCASSHYTMQH